MKQFPVYYAIFLWTAKSIFQILLRVGIIFVDLSYLVINHFHLIVENLESTYFLLHIFEGGFIIVNHVSGCSKRVKSNKIFLEVCKYFKLSQHCAYICIFCMFVSSATVNVQSCTCVINYRVFQKLIYSFEIFFELLVSLS